MKAGYAARGSSGSLAGFAGCLTRTRLARDLAPDLAGSDSIRTGTIAMDANNNPKRKTSAIVTMVNM
jgi:hypothetical protein